MVKPETVEKLKYLVIMLKEKMSELESQRSSNEERIENLNVQLSDKRVSESEVSSEIERLKAENEKLLAERDEKIKSLDDLSMKLKIANANDEYDALNEFHEKLSEKEEEVARLQNLLRGFREDRQIQNSQMVSKLDSEYVTQLQSELSGYKTELAESQVALHKCVLSEKAPRRYENLDLRIQEANIISLNTTAIHEEFIQHKRKLATKFHMVSHRENSHSLIV